LRILLLTQYYVPETGAAQNRLADLATRLSHSSHSVTVLTAMPNYPKGEIFDDYKGHILLDEKCEGVRVIHGWLYATKSKEIVPRIANFISFAVIAALIGIVKTGPQDLVIVESPPLFLGLSGWLLSRWKKCRFVLNISDLWPESAVALGVLRNPSIIRLATRIEEFLYRRSDFITGQTEGIVASIQERFPGKAVQLLPNGVNVDSLLSPSERESTRVRVQAAFGLTDRFVVGYAGLHGLAQNLNTMLDAAQILARQKDILFVFFGDGPEKEELIRDSNRMGLDNVKFYPPQAASRMPELLSAFDVAVVPLRRHRLFSGALPSKLFECMGSGVPVIVAIDGEAKSLVEEAQGGICVEPEDALKLANAIVRLRGDKELRQALGENGREFVTRHYNRQKIAQQFEQSILTLISGRSGKDAESLAVEHRCDITSLQEIDNPPKARHLPVFTDTE